MIIKISGETPFQVLSTTFSIGPSSSGYDLMASADGTNYSKLFTVGANVNRQVTQVAAGSYYKLSGNTDSAVTVNWFGNCVDGNGGGGGGTQYTAGDGIQINGTAISVKAGEGLAFSGDTLIVSGGSAPAEAFTIQLSTFNPEEFTNEDLSAMTEMVEYLADFPVTGLPAARIVNNGNYYTLARCNFIPEDTEEQTPEERHLYEFSYVEAYGDGLDTSEYGYIITFYLNAQDVAESYQVYFDSWEANKYQVVDSLDDANGDEGVIAQVRTAEDEIEYQTIYVTDPGQYPSEGYWAYIKNSDNDYEQEPDYKRAIYMSGNYFYWDWNNDKNGEWQSGSWDDNEYTYRINRNDNKPSQTTFDIYFPEDSPLYLEVDGDAQDAIGIDDNSETVMQYSQPQMFQNGEWSPLYWVIDKSEFGVSSGHTIEVVEKIRTMIERGRYPMIKDSQYFYNFSEVGYGDRLIFKSTGNNWNENRTIEISDEYFDEEAFDEYGFREEYNQYTGSAQHTINIDDGGDFPDPDQLGKFSEESHADQIIFMWRTDVPDSPDWAQAPLKYVYRQIENIGDEDKLVYYWGVDIKIQGVLYHGEWHAVEYDWGNYVTDRWDRENVWIAVESGNTIDTANSIYTLAEFAAALESGSLDKFPFRYFSGGTEQGYGTLVTVMRYPSEYDGSYGIVGMVGCNHKACKFKTFLEYSNGSYNWSTCGWQEMDDVTDPS